MKNKTFVNPHDFNSTTVLLIKFFPPKDHIQTNNTKFKWFKY